MSQLVENKGRRLLLIAKKTGPGRSTNRGRKRKTNVAATAKIRRKCVGAEPRTRTAGAAHPLTRLFHEKNFGAGGGGRTHTAFTGHEILSLARLPVPPLRLYIVQHSMRRTVAQDMVKPADGRMPAQAGLIEAIEIRSSTGRASTERLVYSFPGGPPRT
jgi:hypothetical protein